MKNRYKIVYVLIILIVFIVFVKDLHNYMNKKIVSDMIYYPNGVITRELPHDDAKGEANLTYSEYYDDLYFITVKQQNKKTTFKVTEETFNKNKVSKEFKE